MRFVKEAAQKTENVILIALGCGIVLAVVLGIFFRYTPISGQTMWTQEIARYLFLWAVFWAATTVERDDEHFRFELLRNAMRGKRKLFLQVFTKLVLLIVVALLINSTIAHAVNSLGKTTYILQWPWVIRAVPLFVASLFIFVYTLIGFIRAFQRLVK